MKKTMLIKIISILTASLMLLTSVPAGFASASVPEGSSQKEVIPEAASAEPFEETAENPYVDENGYITSTYGYTLKGDPYVDDLEIWSHNGSAFYDLNAGTAGSRDDIVAAGVDTFYYMSDEFFFGKWDAENGAWHTKGKINYDAYPGLAAMEECVKNGDYEGAKKEYLDYYIERERQANRTKYTITDTSSRIMADLLLKNYMYNPNSGMKPLKLLYLDQTEKWQTMDVSSTVQYYKGSRQELAFLITATDKDGGVAEFYSRETEFAPKLRLVVNGQEIVLTPSADTYICAGSKKGSYFGVENRLYACESQTADEYWLVDENSKRTYVKFDISFLGTGDTVNGATLELYGCNSADNGKEKEVVVFYTDDSGWTETATWRSLPSTIFSYDQLDSWLWVGPGTRQVDWGSRYMEELLRFSGWYNNLIGMYNTTGDEKYAYTVLRILMDYLHVTGQHPKYMKNLDIGCRAGMLPIYLMQILESEYMTPDIFAGIMKYAWIEGNEFLQFFSGGFNWGVMERNGHYTIALFFPEFTDSDIWIDDVRARFGEVVENTINDDGSCIELALGYVWTTVVSPITSMSLAAKYGFNDAPAPLNDSTIDACNRLVKFMMNTSMPGYRDHQEGDTNSHTGVMTSKFQSMYELSRDPVLLYGATKGKQGTKPDYTSIAYRGDGKKVAMRTGWEDDANYLYASVDGSQGTHGHAAECNLMVSAYGQYLLVDPLYGSYSGTAASYWLKSSEAHNVVTVNGNNHAASPDTEMPNWETNNSYDFVTLKTTNATGADNYTRSILFVKPGFWIVNDYLEPTDKENANSYSQTWHFMPEAKPEMDSESKITKTNFSTANIQVVPVDYEKLSTTTLKEGWYSDGMGSVQTANYASYQKRLKGNAVFNTVLYPQRIGEECTITTEPITVDGLKDSQASAYDLFITRNDDNRTSHYQYWQLHDENKKAIRTVGSFTTDASLLLAEFDKSGNVVSVIARNASYIRSNETGKTIWQSTEPISELSLEYSGGYTMLDSSVLSESWLEENNVKIYKLKTGVQELTLNGEATDFNTTSDYIYFGNKPENDAEDNENKDDDKEINNEKPSSGNYGNSSKHGSSGRLSVGTPAVVTPPVTVPSDNTGDVTMNDGMKAEIEGHWAEREIAYLFEKGIIKGVSETSIGANTQITRAEFIALLVRLLNIEPVEYDGVFSDVNGDEWHAGYLQAAFDNGIMHGSDGNAIPDELITREQMAKLICTGAEKLSLTFESADLSRYDDYALISPWALEYAEKVASSGIMTGRTDSVFCPLDNALRAEAFAVIYRLDNLIKNR